MRYGWLRIPWIERYQILLAGTSHPSDTWTAEPVQDFAHIPYKNGKKHGRFKLFRDDGTLEQDLSYKDGVPHGILRWYDDLGNQVTQRSYVDGQPVP